MIYLQLFWSFLKVGFTSFGGLSMVPVITDEMLSHGWMTLQEVSDIVAIAEMTPGPLGLNCATFAGMRTAGLLGAAISNLGTLSPSITVALFVAIFFEKFRRNTLMEHALVGIRPTCIGLIAGVVFTLAETNYFSNGSPEISFILIGVIAFLLLYKLKMSIPKTIGISALLGILVHFIPVWLGF